MNEFYKWEKLKFSSGRNFNVVSSNRPKCHHPLGLKELA